jgi:iron complex outermembrane receptor protein
MHWAAGMDLDGSPEAVLHTSFDMFQHQTSEELQLNGVAVDDRLNYAVGAYYFEEAGHLHDFVTFPMGILMIDGPNDLRTKAEAIYAHLNFKLTEHWGLTLGGRETHEHKEFQGYQTDDNGLSYKISGCNPPGMANNLGAPASLTCQDVLGLPVAGSPYTYYPTGPFTQVYNNFSPTAGVEFHINADQMLYVSYSKGYKTGSWTTRLSSPHPTYDDTLHFNPEFAKSEELGYKSELIDHRLRLNLAAFHTKYDNIQLNSQQGISPTIVNAGDATIHGFEVEAQALIGGGFSVRRPAVERRRDLHHPGVQRHRQHVADRASGHEPVQCLGYVSGTRQAVGSGRRWHESERQALCRQRAEPGWRRGDRCVVQCSPRVVCNVPIPARVRRSQIGSRPQA